jgi:hypothetical protein
LIFSGVVAVLGSFSEEIAIIVGVVEIVVVVDVVVIVGAVEDMMA